ncbi:GntR family transcriptional regulator [Kibdelosporangium lantanae]
MPADPSDLSADRALLDRTSTAERVADVLRTRISEGFFPPGTRLAEDAIGGALAVSRNTLREAFRLLTHERLLVHELNRGVFVRKLTVADVRDIYRVRQVVECGVIGRLTEVPSLDRVKLAIEEGMAAADAEDWRALGTANIRFHQAVVALAESPRLDELMRGVLAELRLVFHVMDDPRQFHEPYLVRNDEIAHALEIGSFAGAEQRMSAYLRDAERQLVRAYPA